MTQDEILAILDTALSTFGMRLERAHEWSAENSPGKPERITFSVRITVAAGDVPFRDIPGPQVAADRAEVSDGFGVVSVPVGGQEFRVIVDETGAPADPDQMSIDDCPDRFPEEGERFSRIQRLAESPIHPLDGEQAHPTIHTLGTDTGRMSRVDAGPPEPQPDDPVTLHGILPGAEALLKPCSIESLPVRRRPRIVDGGKRA